MRTRIPLALRGGGGEHALRESVRGQSQLQQENRVLVCCALESKPQKMHVMRCYLNVKVLVLKSTNAIHIALVLGSVHFEAMLETAPRR